MFDEEATRSSPRERRVGRSRKTVLPAIPEIATADRQKLLAWWQGLFCAEAQKGLSQAFLRRFLAFEVQSRQKGGLARSLLAQLQRIDTGRERRPATALRPGARLLREWNGVTHVVDVTPRGCLWNGKCYRSLSAVARAITGAQWSGPRFFGLAEPPAGSASATPRPSATSGRARSRRPA